MPPSFPQTRLLRKLKSQGAPVSRGSSAGNPAPCSPRELKDAPTQSRPSPGVELGHEEDVAHWNVPGLGPALYLALHKGGLVAPSVNSSL